MVREESRTPSRQTPGIVESPRFSRSTVGGRSLPRGRPGLDIVNPAGLGLSMLSHFYPGCLAHWQLACQVIQWQSHTRACRRHLYHHCSHRPIIAAIDPSCLMSLQPQMVSLCEVLGSRFLLFFLIFDSILLWFLLPGYSKQVSVTNFWVCIIWLQVLQKFCAFVTTLSTTSWIGFFLLDQTETDAPLWGNP